MLPIEKVYAGELTEKHLTKKIKIQGWVNSRRDHGDIIFIDVRDISGLCQLTLDPSVSPVAHKIGNDVRNEYVIEAIGTPKLRSKETINPNLATGTLEIEVSDIKILNTSKAIPFPLEHTNLSNEKTRLQFRYLDLRRKDLQEIFQRRSRVNKIIRDYLVDKRFLEIETPILTKSTPEGARDFLVPSRLDIGKFYALPQSPQIFKQILMVSGFDRYFQIVRCFRDEDLRGNRQPEFTQLDIELSFCEEDTIIELIEGLLKIIFKEIKGIELSIPIQRIDYDEAINLYGLDAPDLRYDLKINDISSEVAGSEFKIFNEALKNGIVNCLVVKDGSNVLTRSMLDELTDFVKIFKLQGLAWAHVLENDWQSPIAKFISSEIKDKVNKKIGANVGDTILFAANDFDIVKSALGNLRKEIAAKLKLINENSFSFCWVTNFPLMIYNKDDKRWESAHHPFTRPNVSSISDLKVENLKNIKAHAYDIVINGVEVGGGSLRIYNSEMQNKIFNLLGINDQDANLKFGFLMEAFKYGAPPHGGIALGLDRLLMMLSNTDSIRDVIAFPKTQTGACLMTEAPSAVDNQQLRDLGIRLTSLEEKKL